jgi:hypothetical protein
MQEQGNPFDDAFSQAVDLGNEIAEADEKADLWDIADGLLAGAVQYWLYTRQPCGDPKCEECLTAPPARAVFGREPVLSFPHRLERRPRVMRMR